MNPIVVVIALVWLITIVLIIKIIIHENIRGAQIKNTPSPHRNSSEVVKARGAKGGLLRYLTYLLISSVTFDEGGFPAPGSYIRISEYYFILPFLYEAGAILGRARHDKIGILRKILYTTTSESEDDIEKVLYRAKKRLEEHKHDFGTEPQTFREFILWTEYRSKRRWFSLEVSAKVSSREVEPYILSLVLEGIEFGSLFSELTEKMNRKFYDSVDIDWDTWTPRGAEAALAPPRVIYGLPGEPTILSLEGQEETLLQVVGDYTSNFHPELIDSLDLRRFCKDEAFIGHRRYSGWWRVYDSLQL